MESVCLDFRSLPDQNKLFLRFVYEPESVAAFYTELPRTDEQWRRRVSRVLETPHFPRRDLVDLLSRLNFGLGGGDAVRANLEALRDPGTVTVVTGQQVGLMGGPGFSVYKAATALRLVERLQRLGVRAVPVFWLASDDSDFEEVRTAWFPVPGEGAVRINHPDTRIGDHEAAGAVPLTENPDWWGPLRTLLARCIESERCREGLLEDYQPGRSFREAFARWIHRIFAGRGLIFFDPLVPEYREGLRDFFQTAIRERDAILQRLRQRDRELAAEGYNPQVKIEETESCLFLWEGLERYKLEFSDGRYRVKGRKGLTFSSRELEDKVASGGVTVTPNVLLRPLVQDYLFPTVTGVGGPAEIAYFAQINAIAGIWGQAPVMYPRAAFTVVDRKSRRLLDRYRLDPGRILRSPMETVLEHMVKEQDQAEILASLDALRTELGRGMADLEGRLADIDPTVAARSRRTAEGLDGSLARLHRRFVLNAGRRNDTLRRHVDHLATRLKPNGHLQERVLSFAGLLADGGPGFLDRILGEIDPDKPGHRVVFL